jgi:colicin import membrane protein
MSERNSDRWISLAQSVLLHGAVVALLAYGWWTYKQTKTPPPARSLAIEAVALDMGDAPKTAAPPRPEPLPPEPQPEPEPPPEETGPPAPTPEEVARREEETRRAEEARKAEEQRIEEETRNAQEKKEAQEREAAERRKRDEAEARKAEEQKRVAELKRKAEEKKKQEEARLRAQRESELRRSLEEEERVMAARSSGAMSNWVSQIQARIQRAWLRPHSARPGIDCMVYVTQIPGGQVTNVRVGDCNGDQAVRESIESAVYRASPLPPPPDPALFERNLEIRFKPVD